MSPIGIITDGIRLHGASKTTHEPWTGNRISPCTRDKGTTMHLKTNLVQMIRSCSRTLVPVTVVFVVLVASSAATAADWSTPEAATRSFYSLIEQIREDPDAPEFKASVEEIFNPDAVIMLVIGDQSAGVLRVSAVEHVAKQLLRTKFRRQVIDAGREISDIQCTTHGRLASCYITVEVTLRDGSERTRSFEDIVGLALDGDRWRISSA